MFLTVASISRSIKDLAGRVANSEIYLTGLARRPVSDRRLTRVPAGTPESAVTGQERSLLRGHEPAAAYDLVVAADGASSAIRTGMAGSRSGSQAGQVLR